MHSPPGVLPGKGIAMNEYERRQLAGKILQLTDEEANDVAHRIKSLNATMRGIICPIDGCPCDPSCPDRYIDHPDGGCILTTVAELSDSVIIVEQLE